MPPSATQPGPRAALLRLAAELSEVDAEPADPLLRDRLQAMVDALCHALVDLADGRALPTVHTPWPPRPTTRRASRPGVDEVDLASCSALAARLRPVAALAEELCQRPLSADVAAAVVTASSALQQFVQDVATARREHPVSPLPQGLTTRLQQQLRRSHALVVADEEPGRTRGRGGITVPP